MRPYLEYTQHNKGDLAHVIITYLASVGLSSNQSISEKKKTGINISNPKKIQKPQLNDNRCHYTLIPMGSIGRLMRIFIQNFKVYLRQCQKENQICYLHFQVSDHHKPGCGVHMC
jgi:hypothetical protein